MRIAPYPPPVPEDPTQAPPPGVRFTPGATLCIEGVGAEALGPEAVGAVTLLCGILADEAKAATFWPRAMGTGLAAREHPGFIRMLGFGDGVVHYALIQWRSQSDADAFAAAPAHREAARAQRKTGEQYNHYAGTFVAPRQRVRHVYCDSCGREATLPATACANCGTELVDGFAVQAGPPAANGRLA
ncbi:MAG: hypothetical protein ACYDAY_00150 [Candidatus Dormibacteria bacterium]